MIKIIYDGYRGWTPKTISTLGSDFSLVTVTDNSADFTIKTISDNSGGWTIKSALAKFGQYYISTKTFLKESA